MYNGRMFYCGRCGVELNINNWLQNHREPQKHRKSIWRICKNCWNLYSKPYANTEKYKKWHGEYDKKRRNNDEYRKIINIKERAKRQKIKEEVYRHYSPELKCVRCGFNDIRALSLDHINGDGARHREEIRKEIGRRSIIEWAKRHQYPDGLQILCMNCQWIKRFENNEVAHNPNIYEEGIKQ